MIGAVLWFSKEPGQQEPEQDTDVAAEQEVGGATTNFALSQGLSEELIKKFQANAESGQEVSEEQLIGAVDSYLEDYYLEDRFSYEDINAIALNSKEAKKKYWNEAGQIFKDNLKDLQRNEFEIFNSALEAESPDILVELDAHLVAYANVVSGLLQLEVPESQAYFHLVFLNAFSNVGSSLELMQNTFDDPAQGLLGIRLSQREIGRMQEAVKKAETELLQDGVEFGEDDPAQYIFSIL